MKLIPLFVVLFILTNFSAFAVQDDWVVLSKAAVSVSEDGTTDSFTMSLVNEPTEDVVINFIDETNEAIVNGTFTFTSQNWNVAQVVTVEGLADDIDDDDQDFQFKYVTQSDDRSLIYDPAVAVSTGYHHACALSKIGSVKCWGSNYKGQLGYGDIINVGDGEEDSKTILEAGNVQVTQGDEKIIQIVSGVVHTCVLLDTGKVRCWGGE